VFFPRSRRPCVHTTLEMQVLFAFRLLVGTSARNGPVYAGIPYRNFLPDFHTNTYQYIPSAFIYIYSFFWWYIRISLLRSTPALLDFHFEQWLGQVKCQDSLSVHWHILKADKYLQQCSVEKNSITRFWKVWTLPNCMVLAHSFWRKFDAFACLAFSSCWWLDERIRQQRVSDALSRVKNSWSCTSTLT
jgi:hypothetical protein